MDIDETICVTPDSRDYSSAKPLAKNIKKINQFYNEGHRIIYWTSRGMGTGVDWTEITKQQLNKWGVRHHELKMNYKPEFDLIIDDKAKSIEEI